MNRAALGVAWYRLRAARAGSWRGYLSLALVVGLIGGLGLAALANARRTNSSVAAFVASTHPSDLSFLAGLYNAPGVTDRAYRTGYDAGLIAAVARLPQVKEVRSYVGINAAPIQKNGAPQNLGVATVEGSVDGQFFNQDRVAPVRGRLANPARIGDVMVSAELAQHFFGGLVLPRAGVSLGVYTNQQKVSSGYGSAQVQPLKRFDVHIVGIVKFSDTLVQDDVDASSFARIVLTPALTRPFVNCCAQDTATYVSLHHPGDLGSVEAAIVRLLPRGATPLFQLTSTITASAQQTVAPDVIAMAVFGGVALLVALIVAALGVARLLVERSRDREILEALGASAAASRADAVGGILGALAVGALLAVAVAVALSPLAPIGPVRPYFPGRGLYVDGPVTVLGSIGLYVLGVALALVLARRLAPARARRRDRRNVAHTRALSRAATLVGLPAPAVTGARFALEPGSGRSAVPVRSAILGVALAVTVVTGTLVFGASLTSLVSHPRLYGWNWDYELTSAFNGYLDIPQGPVTHQLNHDPYVAAWSGIYFGELSIGGLTTPVIGAQPNAPVGPVILSGHGLTGADQVLLGAATLAALHARVGGTVEIGVGAAATRLRVVGVATLPTVGQSGSLHTTMGTGAYLDAALIPVAQRNLFNNPVPGPQAIWVRMRAGTPRVVALHSLRAVANNQAVASYSLLTVLGVQRPAQIVNYRSMGATPTLLGLALVAGALVALEVTLAASVRRRRRDLALLKALGFTHRQIATTVAWQSSVAVALGTLAGVPLGVVAGRVGWTLFADAAHVVPEPAVPLSTVAVIVVGAMVLANALAYGPGRTAARTSVALVLRSE
jgi:hypothetical protein